MPSVLRRAAQPIARPREQSACRAGLADSFRGYCVALTIVLNAAYECAGIWRREGSCVLSAHAPSADRGPGPMARGQAPSLVWRVGAEGDQHCNARQAALIRCDPCGAGWPAVAQLTPEGVLELGAGLARGDFRSVRLSQGTSVLREKNAPEVAGPK